MLIYRYFLDLWIQFTKKERSYKDGTEKSIFEKILGTLVTIIEKLTS